MTKRKIRLVGVEPSVLQRVGIEFGVQPDAATFLSQVQQITTRVCDALDGLAQLRTTVASFTAEYVAGKALAVRSDQRCVCAFTGRDRRDPISNRRRGFLDRLPVHRN